MHNDKHLSRILISRFVFTVILFLTGLTITALFFIPYDTAYTAPPFLNLLFGVMCSFPVLVYETFIYSDMEFFAFKKYKGFPKYILILRIIAHAISILMLIEIVPWLLEGIIGVSHAVALEHLRISGYLMTVSFPVRIAAAICSGISKAKYKNHDELPFCLFVQFAERTL